MKMYQKIFIGLILGCLVGFLLSFMGSSEVAWINSAMNLFSFLGNIFIRLIKMVVVPLVFFSIVSAIGNLKDIKRLKSIGIKTMVIFAATSACAIIIGLLTASVIKPGIGVDIAGAVNTIEVKELPSFYDSILDMIPSNIVESMANAKMLQIIVFSIFLGAALLLMGEKSEEAINVFEKGASIMYKIVDIIILYTPIGVFGLMANATAKYGISILGNIFKFIATDYLASGIQISIVYTLMLIFIAKVNPLRFFRKAFETWIIAFSTCTSMASLPVSMRIAKKDIGIPDSTASFVLPLGATANMDGTAIFLGIIVLFAAQACGIDLTLTQLVMLVVQATLLSIGCAAVPQVGLLIGITMLTSMGLPAEVIGLVTGIYRIIDQAHTSTNALGDLVVATSVSGSDGTLDRGVFNNNEVKLQEAAID